MEDERDNLEATESDKPTDEDVIEDEDADTKDVTNTVNAESAEIFNRMNDFFARLDSIDARLDALANAQAMLVENGATVREVDAGDYEPDTKDDFVPLDELDFSI